MDYNKGMMVLKQKNVFPIVRFPDSTWLKYGWKKVRAHQNKQESFQHFISKACLAKLIIQNGDGMFTEYEYPDCQVVDVLQIKGKELIGYQVETNDFEEKKFHCTDTIVIDLRKAPKSVMEAFIVLKEYFTRYVV